MPENTIHDSSARSSTATESRSGEAIRGSVDGNGDMEEKRHRTLYSAGRTAATNPTETSNSQSQPTSHVASAVDFEKGLPAEGELQVGVSDDGNIVWWDGVNDPENPFNWPTWRKLVNCVLISALTFVTPLASCKSAPGVSLILKYFFNFTLRPSFSLTPLTDTCLARPYVYIIRELTVSIWQICHK